jgi:hypothetical protein
VTGPERYSTRPFPPYRYIPGRAPHPTRDPDGHSHGHGPAPLEYFSADEWRTCPEYLYGIDLFNHRYWWEAHEALEQCWVAAGRDTKIGLFLQGLIQIAVACLKHEQGFEDVARRMAEEGIEKFPDGCHEFLGINLDTLRAGTRAHVQSAGPPPVIKLETVAD